MKKSKLFTDDLEAHTIELTQNEIENISGGESGWYWVSFYLSEIKTALASGVSTHSQTRMEFGK